MKWWIGASLIGIILAVLFSRLWDLGNLPRGLHNDEASIGYNAHLIATTGRDEHEAWFPIYFKAFGEYKNPLHIYTASGLFAIFGTSEFILRLTSVIWFGLFMLLLYFYTRSIFNSPPTTLFVLATAAFLPWFFPVSRMALEVVTQLATLTLFFWMLYKNHSWTAGLALGIFTYSYSTSRLLTALILLSIVCIYHKRQYWTRHLKLFAGTTITLIPLILFHLHNPQALTARFREVTYLYDSNLDWTIKLITFIKNYLHYLSIDYLFISGDQTLRHHIGGGGQIYLVIGFLAIIAILWIATHSAYFRLNRHFRLWLVNLFLAPIPAALTRGDSSLRSLTAGFYLLLLSGLGFYLLRQIQPAKIRQVVIFALLAILAMDMGRYIYRYFAIFPHQSIHAMESYDFKGVLTAAEAFHPTDIVVSNRGQAPYIQLKFYSLLIPIPATLARIDEPVAQPGRCIIYTPFGDTIINPDNLPVRKSATQNFTKLACF